MTPNNYPEGLDELVVRLVLRSADAKGFARALLDALAKRGYVLVDAKKQEPVAHLHYAKKRPDLKEVNFYSSPSNIQKNNGWVSAPLYTHPAIPGRVALPDGWRDALIFARSVIQPDWENSEGENKPMREWCEMADSLLSAATTPPTKPQGDGSLRMGADHEYAIKEGARISACEGYFNARPQIDCLDRRRVFEAGFDRGYDAAMEASNENHD